MSNALVRVQFTVDVPEGKLEQLVGRPDDESQAWHEEAAEKAEEAVSEDVMAYLEYAGEPEVEWLA